MHAVLGKTAVPGHTVPAAEELAVAGALSHGASAHLHTNQREPACQARRPASKSAACSDRPEIFVRPHSRQQQLHQQRPALFGCRCKITPMGRFDRKLTLIRGPGKEGNQHGGDVAAGHALEQGGCVADQQQQGLPLGCLEDGRQRGCCCVGKVLQTKQMTSRLMQQCWCCSVSKVLQTRYRRQAGTQ